MDYEVTRREFLEVSAVAGVAAFTSPRIQAELTAAEQVTLEAVVLDLFPHRGIDCSRAIAAIAARCERDVNARAIVTRGVALLDQQCSGAFVQASQGHRVGALVSLNDRQFIRTVYAEGLEALYGAADAWRLIT